MPPRDKDGLATQHRSPIHTHRREAECHPRTGVHGDVLDCDLCWVNQDTNIQQGLVKSKSPLTGELGRTYKRSIQVPVSLVTWVSVNDSLEATYSGNIACVL